MTRLRQAPPRLGACGPTVRGPAVAQPMAVVPGNPLRGLYSTARWRKLRWSMFVRDLFTCRMCGRLESDHSRLVCDHIAPHRGDLALFWSEANLQTLCKSPCHDQHKQAEEAASRHVIGVWG